MALRPPPLIAILSAALLIAPGLVGAEPAPAASTATPASPAAAISSTTVTAIVTRATASEQLRRAALARLELAGNWRDLDRRVTALESDFAGVVANAAAKSELIDVVGLARQLQVLHRDVSTAVDDLGLIVRGLEHDGNALDADAQKWREDLLFLEKRAAPAPLLERARSTEAKLRATSDRVRESRDSALLAVDRALSLLVRVEDEREQVAVQEERVRSHRMQLERSPLWQLGAVPAQIELVFADLQAAWRVLRIYFVREGTGLAWLFFGVSAMTVWLFTRRYGPDARSAQRAYGRPIAASILIALIVLRLWAPDPPILFSELLLMLVPIPAAMVARRALPAPIPLTLYGVAVATMLIPLRGVIDASAMANRVLLLLQVICIAVPVAVDLTRGRLQRALPSLRSGAVRAAVLLIFAVAAVTAFSVLFGFRGPIGSVRAGMGSILGFGLVFGAAAVALYGAVLGLLATPLLGWLRSARSADPALLRAVRVVLGALAVAAVAIVTLGTYGLLPTLLLAGQSLMSATLEVGTVSVSGNSVAMAVAVVFATIVVAGVTGFILDREILPRLTLRPGAGYAFLTFTRWAIIITGGALALAALGIDMAKVTLLAGALSVGIGFGLQNVVNNFVSGLILIVERPVGVGDVIERGTLSGKVTRIGIRSSTVRTAQGAEVIVPNGDLVSKEVVNWTRSDRQRRYDIDVSVAPGPDPEQVMRLLVEAASEVPEIATEPAPRAMLKGFGAASLDFSLLVWVATIDVGAQAQNALHVAVRRKLDQAGIALA